MQRKNHIKKKHCLAIIHYMPLEFYPPIINLLNYISGKKELINYVFSTKNNKNRKPYENKKIRLYRTSFPNTSDSTYTRFAKYWGFNWFTLFNLILKNPVLILYYESYSAWPVYVYLKYFNTKCKLFIHYHEYSPPQWYKEGMRLVKWYHKLEVKHLYRRATWISHTNSDRLQLFHNDYPFIGKQVLHVLPNYPPSSWATTRAESSSNIISIVYVGALSIADTFIFEFCEWVKKQLVITFDIYSYNYHKEAADYLESINDSNIRFFKEGFRYNQLPQLLSKYNVGVILYKGTSLNCIYSVPNKLFEYLACNLDVWFPKEMKGCYKNITTGTYPKVSMLDFQHLDYLHIHSLISRKELRYQPSSYFCEPVYENFYNALFI